MTVGGRVVRTPIMATMASTDNAIELSCWWRVGVMVVERKGKVFNASVAMQVSCWTRGHFIYEMPLLSMERASLMRGSRTERRLW